jgi:hypothetical protein
MLSNVLFVLVWLAVALAAVLLLTFLVHNRKARIVTFTVVLVVVAGIILASCSTYSCPTYSGAYKAADMKSYQRR